MNEGVTAINDQEMESLLRNFDQIYQGYKDALVEIQTLKLKCSSERMRSEALDTACNDLKLENERLKRAYTETLFKFTNQMKYYTEYRSMKEELEKANSNFLALEEEHKRKIEALQQENDSKLVELEKQLSSFHCERASNEGIIKQLQLELASHEAHIGILNSKLGQVTAEVDAQYQNQMEELRGLVMIEQEEKKDLQKKLQSAENELKIMRNKQAELQRESLSIHHVDALKQKVMKLRKENESLKRKLLVSEFDSA
ncbi:Protein At-4/1 [Carex littledalei]|uniref:Protein At-4/1 n=1 Tax=Carex littledalei TaxID=544730 RepID=A0A833V572_9POAL|nr:Protein At-4/1 [Carex littledalei]